MNWYISKSYTTSKNAIDRQYTERLKVSTITSHFYSTVFTVILLRSVVELQCVFLKTLRSQLV